MNPPVINPTSLDDAMALINASEEKIRDYAKAFGLQCDVVIERNAVHLYCPRRVFKNAQGKRIMHSGSARLGHELWAMIADAGNAASAKAARR